MIQEYLFINNEKIKDPKDMCINKIIPEIEKIDNSDCIIVKYVMSGENKESARELSAINDEIIEKYNPTVLSNESSAYFNKKLYPLFNEFERKLRKLLYLKSALSPQIKGVENIKDLEKKDFGTIFPMLFIDSEFANGVRQSMNGKSWQFTKRDILEIIQKISEHTLWENLIGKNSVPLLCSDFIKVKDYRNDVMHAHNMNTKSFNAAKNLMKKINEQLDTEIGSIIRQKETMTNQNTNNNFNETLGNAINNININMQEVSTTWENLITSYAYVIKSLQEKAELFNSHPLFRELIKNAYYNINTEKEMEKDNNEQNEIRDPESDE